ncbi:DUF4179 domain-containing protein [Paenibacillus dokdonensis]|uniref:DUF4179 domain-containing protein n=1 Tax=Paenibacillus dokdonensis TaxID=2567944 RepID=A0ABU6GRK4_9BACL|nr:DUF4179 domain-containing protein [Paenibacillus dokdonensis]MEC0240787.1 DUF4179 domain-containing protein [Paenibacillus dokdonensis]
MPEVIRGRLDDFYARIESGSIPVYPDSLRHKRGRRFRNGAVAAGAAAVFIGMTVMASAFISPVMAEALKQVPLVGSVFKLAGDLGLQTADEKGLAATLGSSDTHDGVQLRITQAVYDGARLALALEREGTDGQTAPPLHSSYADGQNFKDYDLLKGLDVMINGKSALASQDAFSMLTSGPGKDDQSIIIQYSGKLIGEAQSNTDQLQVRVQVSLNGILEPFELDTVVKKSSGEKMVLAPGIAKSNEFVRFSVDRIEMTPVTINVATTLTQVGPTKDLPARYRNGPILTDPVTGNPKSRVHLSSLYYDLVDDKGKTVNFVSGSGQAGSTTIPEKMNMLFTPFTGTPKTITVKPYYLSTKADGKPVLDQDGNWQKDYVPELVMVIPVK